MSALTYKCPNCGGSMVFDPKQQCFSCEYCLSAFRREELEPPQSDQSDETNESGQADQALLYTCPACGAAIAMDQTTAAGFCYYCHNPVVLSGKLSDRQAPSLVLPFQISREAAEERFLSWIGHKKYIPPAFFSRTQLEKLSGVYFPYWTCSCTMEGTLSGTATDLRVWRTGDTEYTETKTYSIQRSGRITLSDLSRNALQKAQVRMLEGILPFDLTKAERFHPGYLSGFQAEVKDMERETFESEVREEAEIHAKKLLMDTVAGHGRFSVENFHTAEQSSVWQYVLLPVWILTYRKNEELYYFAMNGQTGEICGRLPIDYARLAAACIGIFAAVTAAFTLAGGLLL